MPTDFKTPVARLVWGNPLRSQHKKSQEAATKGQVILKDGKPIDQWAWGLAIPKAEFQQQVQPYLEAEARGGYPNGVPPRFSWKVVDGDGVDSKGKRYSNRDGYAGHYILTVTTEAFAPTVVRWDGRQYVQMTEAEIKTGDYVVCDLSAKVNVATGQNTPSLYINPKLVLFVAYGQAIINATADPVASFGAQPQQYALPPGASLTPLAPQTNMGAPGAGMMQPQQQPGGFGQPGMMQPGMMQPPPQQQPMYQQPQQPMQQGYPPAPQQPVYQQPQQPMQQGYPPAHDFVQNAGHQQPQPGMMQPPPQQQPMYQQPQPGMMQPPPQQQGFMQPGQAPGMVQR